MISVIQPGTFTTIQDLGRVGYQNIGVTESGAMDQFALRCANILVGNPDHYAGMEVTLFGPELEFHEDHFISITGADLLPIIDGERVSLWETIKVRSGQKLVFKGPQKNGIRCYIAFGGGIDGGAVKEILGSRSTYVQGKLGGYEGRALMTGDEIITGNDFDPPSDTKYLKEIPSYSDDVVLRVILGPQEDKFVKESVDTLLSNNYIVSANSDRMGYRLEGPSLKHLEKADVISDGNAFGVIQVPADGLPIILGADRGTTGGYAKIATVITADRGQMAQMVPGSQLRFEEISLEDALCEYSKQEQILENLITGTTKVRIFANEIEVEVTGSNGERINIPQNYDSMSVNVADRLNESIVNVSFK